jgi:hypothetical protein
VPIPASAPAAPTASTASGASSSGGGHEGLSGLSFAILGSEIACLAPQGQGLVESGVAEAVVAGSDNPGSRPD